MASYRRVTYEDRCQIQAYLQVKLSVGQIAANLRFHKSTIYREISRNSIRRKFDPKRATEKAEQRFRRCRRHYLISGDQEGLVLAFLFSAWSPEQISGRLASEGVASLNHQTIYNYIRRHGRYLKPYLRRFNRRGSSRVCMQAHKRSGKISIDLRPVESGRRTRIGDWERDCCYGANRKQLLVCADRKSRFTKIAVLEDASGKGTTNLTNRLLKAAGKPVHTITNDNGPEFKNSKGTMAPVYYCHPRKPQQRGTVENTVGLIRQFIKRKTDITTLTRQDIQNIEDALNLRPRKCLDYKTPYEVFYGKSVALAV